MTKSPPALSLWMGRTLRVWRESYDDDAIISTLLSGRDLERLHKDHLDVDALHASNVG